MKESAGSTRRSIKAIIVDDEHLVRKGIRLLLPWSKHGIEIVGEAAGGEEALALLDRERCELLVTDITMPYMDGLELMKLVRERHVGVHTVVLTCHQDFDYLQRALRLGALDYIVKTQLEDQNLDELLARISARVREMGHDRGRAAGMPPTADRLGELAAVFDSAGFEELLGELASAQPEQERERLAAEAAACWHAKLPVRFGPEWAAGIAGRPVGGADPLRLLRQGRDELCARLRQSNLADDMIAAILQAVDRLHRGEEMKLSQTQLCAELGMSASYFSRTFKLIVGTAFVVYQQDVQLQAAMRLLEGTNQPIYAIAEKAGFQDEKYFSKMFKTKVGMLPSEYRHSRRAQAQRE